MPGTDISTTVKRTGMLVVAWACLTWAALSNAADESVLQEAVHWYTGQAGLIDDNKASELLELAVATEDPLAIMWLARVYSTGRMGYSADKERAQQLAAAVLPHLEQLAEQDDPEAEFLLGTAWAEGLGKPVDAEQAVDWYRKAAFQGHVLAQHNLGNVYASGTGVLKDDAAAVYWWRLAAEQGDAIPAWRLGNCYETGCGVPVDLELAIYWHRQAAGRGYAAAADALQRLEGSLPVAP